MAPRKKTRKAGTKRRTSAPEGADEVLLMILGSGPSVAAFESMLQANAANGSMYHNAVANQQKTNLLGMAMTAKCIRYMLDPPKAASAARTKRKR
ncbi:MAG TPA: RebB family R body protein [Rhizomicrobium sp.]|jgi:hypothetical protein|nr:RebB family R body protein [Rhizomicrobium sp.]